MSMISLVFSVVVALFSWTENPPSPCKNVLIDLQSIKEIFYTHKFITEKSLAEFVLQAF